MSNTDQIRQDVRQPRRTLRLTFRVSDGEVQLVSHERLQMICPPSIGEIPQTRKHGGFWMELRDEDNRVIFHRLIHSPLAGSVEVHSPDGKIRREFGEVKESVFEVLLPDNADATSIVLMGESLESGKAGALRAEGSAELARFEIPGGDKGGRQ